MLAANYPSKKALKAETGNALSYTETSFFGPEYKSTGTLYVVGPSPYVRKWYAQVTMIDGKIVKVS